MTEEKLLKKAIEYREKLVPYTELVYPDVEIPVYSALHISNAYIAGAKENGVVWHDLRKEPDDLPPQSELYWDVSKRVLGSYKIANNQYISNILRYCYAENCWKLAGGTLHEKIIAWCEIPNFEEIKE